MVFATKIFSRVKKLFSCNKCSLFVHIKCNGISASEYRGLENEPDVHSFCKLCIQDMFPFGSLENDELSVLYDFDVPSLLTVHLHLRPHLTL